MRTQDPLCQLSDRLQLLATNSRVHETTHRLIIADDFVELRHKGSRICDLVGIITPTIESDGDLLISDIRDVFDGAGLKLEHNELKK